jgi:hypothetical protein
MVIPGDRLYGKLDTGFAFYIGYDTIKYDAGVIIKNPRIGV